MMFQVPVCYTNDRRNPGILRCAPLSQPFLRPPTLATACLPSLQLTHFGTGNGESQMSRSWGSSRMIPASPLGLGTAARQYTVSEQVSICLSCLSAPCSPRQMPQGIPPPFFTMASPVPPAELIHAIFDRFRDKTMSLCNCSRVCRHWVPPSRRHRLFTDITLDRHTVGRFLRLLRSKGGPSIAPHIRTLHLHALISLHLFLTSVPVLVPHLHHIASLRVTIHEANNGLRPTPDISVFPNPSGTPRPSKFGSLAARYMRWRRSLAPLGIWRASQQPVRGGIRRGRCRRRRKI